MAKRKGTYASRAAKKGRTANPVTTVVRTVAHADALPQDLRTALQAALPVALKAYKSDRHAFETEVIAQGADALKAAEAALKATHAEAMAKQQEVIAPAEMKRREAAKEKAAGNLEAMKNQVESCKVARKEAEKSVHDAENSAKAAAKEAKAADKDLKALTDKKSTLENVLANEFAQVLADASASAAGRKAVTKLITIGRANGVGATLLKTFPNACKKKERTEFEQMALNRFKQLIDIAIDENNKKIAEAEPVKAGKDSASNDANAALDAAKTALQDAEKALSDKQNERSEASKELTKADAHLRHVWEDMRKVCDHQDALAAEVANFETGIWAAFNELKEHEAPVPEPEPVAEEPEAAPDAAAEAAVDATA